MNHYLVLTFNYANSFNSVALKLLKRSTYSEVIIFVFCLLIRLPSLGYDIINNDAFLWKERSYAFGAALMSMNFAGTDVTYHPGVSLLYMLFIANKIFSILSLGYIDANISPQTEFFINHAIQKFTVVLVISILLSLIYYYSKYIIGTKKALLVMLILNLEPFYLALSREIHTDALLSNFMILSLLTYYLSTKSGEKIFYNNRLFLLSAFFTALAMLTKSTAIILIMFYGLFELTKFVMSKKPEILRNYLIYLSICSCFFLVMWPAMWINPFGTLRDYIFGISSVGIEEGHGHIWFGVETLDPGILFYPLAILSRFTGELTIIFILGAYIYLKSNKKNILQLNIKTLSFNTFLTLFSIVFFAIISFATKKLDRYALVLIFAFIYIGVFYLDRYIRNKLLYLVLFIYIITRAYLLYGLNPNYLAYYSPLVGGMDVGYFLIEPKWLIGYDNVAEYFNSKKNAKTLKVAIADHDYLRPFGVFQTLNIKHDVEAKEADYFVLPVYRPERLKYYIEKYHLTNRVDQISIAGIDYYSIYRVEKNK